MAREKSRAILRLSIIYWALAHEMGNTKNVNLVNLLPLGFFAAEDASRQSATRVDDDNVNLAPPSCWLKVRSTSKSMSA